jgi:tetratricopeptide (TPR) repeat protein
LFYSKRFLALITLTCALIAQNNTSLFNATVELGVHETEDRYTVTLLYDFEGPIKSRRFENLRSKSRLDALDQIAAYIYINTIYDIKTSDLTHPHIFIDAVTTLKPFKVRAKISKLKILHFGRLTPSTVKAIFSMPKDDFKIVELTRNSLAGMSVKDILNKVILKQPGNEEIVLWLLDLEDSFRKRRGLISQLTATMKLADISELEDAAFTKLNLNETIVKSVTGEISIEQKNKLVSDGIALLNSYSRKDYSIYSNILVSELFKYGVKQDELLDIYIQNLNKTADLQWIELIQFVHEKVIDTDPGYKEDSLDIVHSIYTSLGLLNLENEQFDDAYKDHYNTGVALFTASEIDSALVHFLNSLENESINANVLNFIGACYRIKDEPVHALPFLIQCLELDPEHEYAWGNLAICIDKIGYDDMDIYTYLLTQIEDSNWSKTKVKQIIKDN